MSLLNRCKLCRIDVDSLRVVRGGQEVLKDVSMHIHCGQLTVLIGQNGAGKTTLIRSILGEIPHEGSIRHEDGRGRPMPHLRTGYVPQHLNFDREMPLTVCDLVGAALSRRPVWTGVGRKTREEVRNILATVHAQDLMERPLGRCSGGEIQRVLLALALNPDPDLLILDEPVAGVDQNGQRMFLDTVNEIRRGRHMAILMVSHDLPLVREYADHVVLLDRTVLAQGSPRAVFDSEAFQQVFGSERRE